MHRSELQVSYSILAFLIRNIPQFCIARIVRYSFDFSDVLLIFNNQTFMAPRHYFSGRISYVTAAIWNSFYFKNIRIFHFEDWLTSGPMRRISETIRELWKYENNWNGEPNRIYLNSSISFRKWRRQQLSFRLACTRYTPLSSWSIDNWFIQTTFWPPL